MLAERAAGFKGAQTAPDRLMVNTREAVDTFTRLCEAINAADFDEANRARKALVRLGFSLMWKPTAGRKGVRP